MKKYILLLSAAALCLAACTQKADHFDYGQEIALITGTDASPISKDQILADEIPISYNFSVSLTGVAQEDVQVHIAYDSLAVVRYNAVNKTNYAAVPRNTFVINDEFVTIKKGTATSPMTSVTLRDNSFIQEGVNYVIPLAVAYMDGGKAGILDASKNLFIKIGKTMETFSLDIPGTGVYSTHSLGAGYNLNTWTLEIKAHPYNMKSRGNDQLCRFCCWNEDGGGQVLLRFNENGKPWKTLDIVAPSGRYVTGSTGDPATGSFEQNQWYMISIVWDGSNMSVYINGEKDTPTENSVSGNQAFNRHVLGRLRFFPELHRPHGRDAHLEHRPQRQRHRLHAVFGGSQVRGPRRLLEDERRRRPRLPRFRRGQRHGLGQVRAPEGREQLRHHPRSRGLHRLGQGRKEQVCTINEQN